MKFTNKYIGLLQTDIPELVAIRAPKHETVLVSNIALSICVPVITIQQ